MEVERLQGTDIKFVKERLGGGGGGGMKEERKK